MASDIWLRTILIVRKETRCHHIGYSFRLAARVLLYAPSHRQDNTYHGLCYTSRGALAGMRNSSMGPPHEGSIRRPIAPWANALPLSYVPLRTSVERQKLTGMEDIERKPAAATWDNLSDKQQDFFYMHHPTNRIAHTTAFDTPVVEHWLEWELAQWVHHEGSFLTETRPNTFLNRLPNTNSIYKKPKLNFWIWRNYNRYLTKNKLTFRAKVFEYYKNTFQNILYVSELYLVAAFAQCLIRGAQYQTIHWMTCWL